MIYGCSLPSPDTESYKTRSERCDHHAQINNALAGRWPAVLLCKPGVMFDAIYRGVVQAQKSEHQREDSYATHKPTMSFLHLG